MLVWIRLVNPIAPGMVLSAEILTDDRSLLQYLMRPVYRGIERGLSRTLIVCR